MRNLKIIILTLFVTISSITVFSQNKIKNGPMLGYSEMREVLIWVQAHSPEDVYAEYYLKKGVGEKFRTKIVKTGENKAYIAKLIADSVEPGNEYTYEIYVGGEKQSFDFELSFRTQPIWKWRGDPPTIKFAAGSCAYINEEIYDRPGKPYGASTEIFASIFREKPEFMLWLGDNIYFREPDWNSLTGMIKRYEHDRSIPEFAELLANVHHYAIWDDHDYGPNNSDRSFWNKGAALEVFSMFWGNPSYGFPGMEGAITFFEWGDAAFFLLDDRWYRSPEKRKFVERKMLGDLQIEWLIDALSSSEATFKFIAVGSQVLNPAARYENYSTYPEERNKLLKMIDAEKIPGIIFLTGDRHFSEITKLEREGNYPLFDFTISPFTSGPSKTMKMSRIL